MKYIKEYKHMETEQFETSEIEDIKDAYYDMVDDLDLCDNPFKILHVDDSSFHHLSMLKEILIYIRTIVSDIWHFGEFKQPTKEQLRKHDRMLELIDLYLIRIKRMGYNVEVKNLTNSTGPDDIVISGIEIKITK